MRKKKYTFAWIFSLTQIERHLRDVGLDEMRFIVQRLLPVLICGSSLLACSSVGEPKSDEASEVPRVSSVTTNIERRSELLKRGSAIDLKNGEKVLSVSIGAGRSVTYSLEVVKGQRVEIESRPQEIHLDAIAGDAEVVEDIGYLRAQILRDGLLTFVAKNSAKKEVKATLRVALSR